MKKFKLSLVVEENFALQRPNLFHIRKKALYSRRFPPDTGKAAHSDGRVLLKMAPTTEARAASSAVGHVHPHRHGEQSGFPVERIRLLIWTVWRQKKANMNTDRSGSFFNTSFRLKSGLLRDCLNWRRIQNVTRSPRRLICLTARKYVQ